MASAKRNRQRDRRARGLTELEARVAAIEERLAGVESGVGYRPREVVGVDTCEVCGSAFPVKAGGPPRVYCSAACRQAAYRQRVAG
jgi:hypothetical protein